MIDFEKNTIDLDFFKSIIHELYTDGYDRRSDILDSFGKNQFNSKSKIIKSLIEYNLIDKTSHVAILGSWYGSILIASLADKVKFIDAYDLDEISNRFSKNRLYPHLKGKVSWIQGDVFSDIIRKDFNVVINTSCEHMPPMKDWPYWTPGIGFAVTSNNMYDIEGHINCVETIDDFAMQLPLCDILFEDTISDERGDRFLIIGKTK